MNRLSYQQLAILELLQLNRAGLRGLQMVYQSSWLGRGTVYVHLVALEDLGYVTRCQDTEDPHQRQIFHITKEGGHRLRSERSLMELKGRVEESFA